MGFTYRQLKFGRDLLIGKVQAHQVKTNHPRPQSPMMTFQHRATQIVKLLLARLANDKNLTAYEASYAILAKRMDIPLITADEPMVKVIEWAIGLGDKKNDQQVVDPKSGKQHKQRQ